MDEPFNPYASPSVSDSSSGQSGEKPVVVPAARLVRFVNCLIDNVVLLILAFGSGMVIVIVGGSAGVEFLDNTPDLVFSMMISIPYFIIFEATTSRTVGKLITGTKVVNHAGGPPTVGQIVGRALCRYIPFDALSFFTGYEARGWHDTIPQTFVVKAS